MLPRTTSTTQSRLNNCECPSSFPGLPPLFFSLFLSFSPSLGGRPLKLAKRFDERCELPQRVWVELGRQTVFVHSGVKKRPLVNGDRGVEEVYRRQ